MKDLDSRSRILILTTLISIVYILLQEFDFRLLLGISNLNFDPIKPLILSIIIYFGTYWALFFKIRGERFISILMFPTLTVFALSLLSEIIVANVFTSISQISVLLISTIVHWVFTYITLLTVNILNTSYTADIPLGQAARAAQFVLTLVIAYVYFFLLFSNDIIIFTRVILIFFITFLMIFISLASIKLRSKQRVIAAVDISLLLALASFILSIWPISAPYAALGIDLIMYICLGIALEIREIISKWIMVEYYALFALIFFMLLLIAEWGINGILL